MKLRNVQQVASWRLCIGCGACAYVCPEKNITLIDVVDDGIRPFLDLQGCESCDECIKVCPGYETEHRSFNAVPGLIPKLKKSWGPVVEIWEGYAADSEIHFHGSSGGLCTAIAQYCLEKKGMYGVLHTGADKNIPWKNSTHLSCNSLELIERTGSRYAPASPCDGLTKIEYAPSYCVFIGKPCDVTGLRKAQALRPKLAGKIGLAIGFFCAGTPSTQGTLDFFKSYNVKPKDVAEFRYRGEGWPGMATIKFKEKKPSIEVSYKDSWGFVQRYRPFRCYLCPDLTAEFADISFGDPWYREIKEDDPGRSLILVRTDKGRKIFHEAMDAGYVISERVDIDKLYQSQKNLLTKRQAIWGRLLAMKALGIPTPKLEGFHLFENWLDLPNREKVRSIFGTARRVIQRKYYRPSNYIRDCSQEKKLP